MKKAIFLSILFTYLSLVFSNAQTFELIPVEIEGLSGCKVYIPDFGFSDKPIGIRHEILSSEEFSCEKGSFSGKEAFIEVAVKGTKLGRYWGDIEKGKFQDDNASFMMIGLWYEGSFQDGQIVFGNITDKGWGKLREVGSVDNYEGEFENYQKHGYGKKINKDGDFYEGEFYKDKVHGRGTITTTDGIIIDIIAENGHTKEIMETRDVYVHNFSISNTNSTEGYFVRERSNNARIKVKKTVESIGTKSANISIFGANGSCEKSYYSEIVTKSRKRKVFNHEVCGGLPATKCGKYLDDNVGPFYADDLPLVVSVTFTTNGPSSRCHEITYAQVVIEQLGYWDVVVERK